MKLFTLRTNASVVVFCYLTALVCGLSIDEMHSQQMPVTTTSPKARAYFEQGRLHAFHWQSEQAQELLYRALELDSNLVLAYIHLAGTSPRNDRAPFMRRAEELKPVVTEGEQLLVDAFRAFLVDREYQRAVNILTELSRKYPDDPYLQGYLGMRHYSHIPDLDKSMQHFRNALDIDPDLYPAFQLMGWVARKKGDWELAEKNFKINLRMNPDQPMPYLSLAQLYVDDGRYDEALEVLRRLIEIEVMSDDISYADEILAEIPRPERSLPSVPITTNSNFARLYFIEGRDQAHHYQFAAARDYLDAALEIDSTFVMALLHRGGSANSTSEQNAYLAKANRYRHNATLAEQIMVDAFLAFLRDRDYHKAVKLFSKLKEQFPGDPYLTSYLGLRFYRNLDMYDAATNEFRAALDRDSSFVQAYYWLGRIAYDKGNTSGAERYFRMYLRSAPHAPRAHDALGIFYLQNDRVQEAKRYFEQAIRADHRYLPAYDNLARASIQQANSELEKAVTERNVSAIVAQYHSDASLITSHGTVLRGTDAIEDFWQQLLDAGVSSVALESHEVIAGAQVLSATEFGTYVMQRDEEIWAQGHYSVVWTASPEGWMVYRSMFTSGQPDE